MKLVITIPFMLLKVFFTFNFDAGFNSPSWRHLSLRRLPSLSSFHIPRYYRRKRDIRVSYSVGF